MRNYAFRGPRLFVLFFQDGCFLSETNVCDSCGKAFFRQLTRPLIFFFHGFASGLTQPLCSGKLQFVRLRSSSPPFLANCLLFVTRPLYIYIPPRPIEKIRLTDAGSKPFFCPALWKFLASLASFAPPPGLKSLCSTLLSLLYYASVVHKSSSRLLAEVKCFKPKPFRATNLSSSLISFLCCDCVFSHLSLSFPPLPGYVWGEFS